MMSSMSTKAQTDDGRMNTEMTVGFKFILNHCNDFNLIFIMMRNLRFNYINYQVDPQRKVPWSITNMITARGIVDIDSQLRKKY